MIEKMAYVNFTGHTDDFDRVVEKYLMKYDMQLEDSLTRKGIPEGLFPFDSNNPYINVRQKAERLIQATGLSAEATSDFSKERALEIIDIASDYYNRRDEDVKKLEVKREIYREYISTIGHFEGIDIRAEHLAKFKLIKYRFGRMPLNSFKQFEAFLLDDADIIFFTGKTEEDFIYAFYFVPDSLKDKADSMFSSLHFERIWVSYELDGNIMSGTPAEILLEARAKLAEIEKQIRELHTVKLSDLSMTSEELASACAKIREICLSYETRKHAARTRKNYFIFSGWMKHEEALMLEKEIDGDGKVMLVIEQGNAGIGSKPPTVMKNIAPVKPFEFFVKMYGLPAYNEIDPTPLVALTYTLIFGIMFGDLGQGLVIALIGLFLKRIKGMELGSVMSIIGVSSMFFGIMYGSVFGLEHVIPAVWMKPSENVMQILAVTIGIGVLLIVVSMIINIINSAGKKDWIRMTLSPNGFAGLIFYSAVIAVALGVYTGNEIAGNLLIIIIVLFVIVPLLGIALREPIKNWIKGKNRLIEGGVGLFFLETFIEVFETLLSYFSNTISFIRVGAFALSHAGMMSVVLLLSTGANDTLNPVVLILGNIFVIVMEGLVVGIQVLRLEFYEIFSRFYGGDGRDFKPNKRVGKF